MLRWADPAQRVHAVSVGDRPGVILPVSCRQISAMFFGMMVARDGVEPPTPAFSELRFSVFPTTSKVAVGLLNTRKYGQHGWIVGDCRG